MRRTLPLPFGPDCSQVVFQGTEGIPQEWTHPDHYNIRQDIMKATNTIYYINQKTKEIKTEKKRLKKAVKGRIIS